MHNTDLSRRIFGTCSTALLLLFLFGPPILAQTSTSTLDSLHAAFWPDYDRPAVLVLLTGSLPAETDLPAVVSFPLPANADLNAVARFDAEIGLADIEYQVDGDTLTFSTPNEQFRVEYYVPYEGAGSSRSFEFNWNSALNVQEFAAEIQQPVNARNLTSQPQATNRVTNPTDGMTYHILPTQVVPAGTPLELGFRYDIAAEGLTVGPDSPIFASQVVDEGSFDSDRLLLLAGLGLLLLMAIIATVVVTRRKGKGNNRQKRKVRKARKTPAAQPAAKSLFCHACGQQAGGGDRYCRNCGTELKQT